MAVESVIKSPPFGQVERELYRFLSLSDSTLELFYARRHDDFISSRSLKFPPDGVTHVQFFARNFKTDGVIREERRKSFRGKMEVVEKNSK